jgi:hypothetical protein
VLVRHPDGFYGNHRVEAWPLLQRWEGREVRDYPDASAHTPSMGVVERVKEIVSIAPRQVVLDVLMKVCFDGRIGLFVVALQGSEVVAALGPDLVRNSSLAVHSINRHHTPLDGE